MITDRAANNPPLTAAGLASVVVLCLAAFTTLTADQVAAVAAAVTLLAGFAAQRWTTPWRRRWPDEHQDEHADPDDLHGT